MAKRTVPILLFLAFIACVSWGHDYVLRGHVLGGGGARETSDERISSSTVGQSIVGKTQGGSLIVNYGYWYGRGIGIPLDTLSIEPPYDITTCSTSESLYFCYDATPLPAEVRGYEVTFSVSPTSYARVQNYKTDIREEPFLSDLGTTLFAPKDNGGGSYTVSCILLGGSSGATGEGVLFHVKLTPVAQGSSDIMITKTKFRDVNNDTIGTFAENGRFQVDCTPPWMDWPLAEPNGRYYHKALRFLNFTFHDDVNLDSAQYRIDSGAWRNIFGGVDSTDHSFPGGFVFGGLDSLPEGSHVVYFRVKDDAGNWDGKGYSWQFYADHTPPTMGWPLAEAPNQYYKEAPKFLNVHFYDNMNLDCADYRIDLGTWQPIFSGGIDSTECTRDSIRVRGFGDLLGEGPHVVYFRVKDDAGNVTGETEPYAYAWRFIQDRVAPHPPSDFLAAPGHTRIHLTWSNPEGDTTFAGVVIRRTRWVGYPTYHSSAPLYPHSQTEEDLVIVTGSEACDDSTPYFPRDIYYYSAFAFDTAGNYSAFDSVGAADRSTNYWLGDIAPAGAGDGEVETDDLVYFSNAFGTEEGDDGWEQDFDFAPTDPKPRLGIDASNLGIPEPDDKIDFEDGMILGMNWGRVKPWGMGRVTQAESLAVESLEEMRGLVSFKVLAEEGSEASGATGTISLVIENRARSLKGFRVLVDYGAGNELVSVSRGALISDSPGCFFGTIPVTQGKVEISVIALGVHVPFEGSGQVARLVVRSGTNSAPIACLEEIDLRNLKNETRLVEPSSQPSTPFIPSATALLQNFPNPFNPVTTITYDLATGGNVSIQIFDVSGRLVRTLVDGDRPVGRYQVDWDGKSADGTSVPSGLYFCEMKGPGNVYAIKKMLVLR